MNDQIKVNRPGFQTHEHQQGGGMPPQGGEYRQQEPQGGSKLPWIVLIIVVVLIIIGGVLFRDKLFGSKSSMNDGGKKTSSSSSMEKSSGWQAVFLTNGQVYFGKLTKADTQWPTMKEIYYLQVTQPPLQGSQQEGQQAQAQPQLSLVKLGNELHGPADEMSINRDQILFYEDMKSDSQVVKAISDYKNGQTPAPAK